jgi:hypothetical protein
MNEKKILFIQPYDKSVIPSTGKRTRRKAYLPRSPFEVGFWIPPEYELEVLDLNLELVLHPNKTHREIIASNLLRYQLKRQQSSLDVIFLTFPTYAQGEHISEIVRVASEVLPSVPVVIGGSNIALVKDAPFRWDWPIAACYSGWGEEISALIDALTYGNLPNIPGVYWHSNWDDPTSNPDSGIGQWSRELCDGYAAKHFYSVGGRINFSSHLKKYQEAGIEVMAVVEMTRGCPMHCSFCALNGERMGHFSRSVQTVVSEVEYLASVGIEYIHIIDPTFGSFARETDAFIQSLVGIKQQYSRLQFEILTRSELVTEERANQWSEMGVVRCGIGMETMTQASLDAVNKHTKSDTTHRAAHFLSKAGIETKLFHILFPGCLSTETVAFLDELDREGVPFRVQSSMLRDLPMPISNNGDFLQQDQTIFVPGKDTLHQLQEWLLVNLAFPSMDIGQCSAEVRESIRKVLQEGGDLESLFMLKDDGLWLGSFCFDIHQTELRPMVQNLFTTTRQCHVRRKHNRKEACRTR